MFSPPPQGREFVNVARVETQTGYPVRSDYKNPDAADVLPAPDAIVIAPATVNTINKWAAGISDTLPLGILVEAIGKQIPTVAVPFTNYAHAAHPAFEESIAKLRKWGVTVIYGDDVYPSSAADQHERSPAPAPSGFGAGLLLREAQR